jgi:IS30 family transposase
VKSIRFTDVDEYKKVTEYKVNVASIVYMREYSFDTLVSKEKFERLDCIIHIKGKEPQYEYKKVADAVTKKEYHTVLTLDNGHSLTIKESMSKVEMMIKNA